MNALVLHTDIAVGDRERISLFFTAFDYFVCFLDIITHH